MPTINNPSATDWQSALSAFPSASFLQSWAWGEFQAELGNNVVRVLLQDGGKNVGLAQTYVVKSKFDSFLYCPRGPLAHSEAALGELLQMLKQVAREQKVTYLLIEPDIGTTSYNQTVYNAQKLTPRAGFIQPHNTSMVSLLADLTTIEAQVRTSTRQCIKGAAKKHVTIVSFDDTAHWQDFANLLQITAARQGFIPHHQRYLQKQFEFLAQNAMAKLYLALLDGQPVAGAVMVYFNQTATYLHAASSDAGRSVGAAQLLVMTTIADAKNNGMTQYDFWGIAPLNQPEHPWAGISTFKRGFGGTDVHYPGAFVYPVRKVSYTLLGLITLIRRNRAFKSFQRILFRKSIKP